MEQQRQSYSTRQRVRQAETTSTGKPLDEVKVYEIGYGYLARVVWKLYVFSGDDSWIYIRRPVSFEVIRQ